MVAVNGSDLGAQVALTLAMFLAHLIEPDYGRAAALRLDPAHGLGELVFRNR